MKKKRKRKKRISLRARLVRICSMEEARLELGLMDQVFK